MAFIQTVTGKISPDEMGITYCHEHILFKPPPPYDRQRPEYCLDDIEKEIQELSYFKMAGGSCIIEMSTAVTNRSPKGMQEISKKTGVFIVAATGFHKDIYSEPVLKNLTVDEIVCGMIMDLMNGMDGTEIKAGVIKASSSKNKFSDCEEKIFQAAAIAHHETGATISTHTDEGTMALEQVRRLKNLGVNPDSIVIGHISRKLDFDFLTRIAQEGVYLGFDGISKVKFYPDELRIQMLKKLIKAGFAHQIMLSGDFGRYTYFPSYGFGYGPGYTYILWRFVPWMLREGISQKDVNQMLVLNPAKAFQWKKIG